MKKKEEVNKEVFKPYKIDKLARIPLWLKILFAKFWGAGAVFFFMVMGTFFTFDFLDGVVIVGTVLGLVTDYIINGIIRWCHTPEEPAFQYRAVNMKGSAALFLNILYGIVIMALIMLTYNGLNILIINIQNLNKDSVPLAAEPLGYGLLYILYDFIWIRIRGLIEKIIGGKKNEV